MDTVEEPAVEDGPATGAVEGLLLIMAALAPIAAALMIRSASSTTIFAWSFASYPAAGVVAAALLASTALFLHALGAGGGALRLAVVVLAASSCCALAVTLLHRADLGGPRHFAGFNLAPLMSWVWLGSCAIASTVALFGAASRIGSAGRRRVIGPILLVGVPPAAMGLLAAGYLLVDPASAAQWLPFAASPLDVRMIGAIQAGLAVGVAYALTGVAPRELGGALVATVVHVGVVVGALIVFRDELTWTDARVGVVTGYLALILVTLAGGIVLYAADRALPDLIVLPEVDPRTSAATIRAAPARPLGPGAATWYAAGDLRFLLLATRTLVLQVAHPMVGAGVGQHSAYKTNPYRRLWQTALSVVRQVFGGYDAAEEGRRLLALHEPIKGVDDRGRRYSARNPGAYVWVHATMFDAWRIFLRDYGPGLRGAQEAQLFDEWRRVGLLIGCEDRLLPRTLKEFDDYFAAMLPELEDNAVVQDLLQHGPKAPPLCPQLAMDLVSRPLLALQRSFVAETLPADLAAAFGLERSPRTARHTRWLGAFSRVIGVVPALLRRSPLAAAAMWRTSRDPRIEPEPVRYP